MSKAQRGAPSEPNWRVERAQEGTFIADLAEFSISARPAFVPLRSKAFVYLRVVHFLHPQNHFSSPESFLHPQRFLSSTFTTRRRSQTHPRRFHLSFKAMHFLSILTSPSQPYTSSPYSSLIHWSTSRRVCRKLRMSYRSVASCRPTGSTPLSHKFHRHFSVHLLCHLIISALEATVPPADSSRRSHLARSFASCADYFMSRR